MEFQHSQRKEKAHLFEPLLQAGELALLDNEGLIVEIFDDVVMLIMIDLENDGFDGRITFDQHPWLLFFGIWFGYHL